LLSLGLSRVSKLGVVLRSLVSLVCMLLPRGSGVTFPSPTGNFLLKLTRSKASPRARHSRSSPRSGIRVILSDVGIVITRALESIKAGRRLAESRFPGMHVAAKIQNAIDGKMPHAMQCNANQKEKKEVAKYKPYPWKQLHALMIPNDL
jgi:hypothetical protein